MQTAGMEMDLDGGLFQLNGLSGYVLKPEILRSGNIALADMLKGLRSSLIGIQLPLTYLISLHFIYPKL